MAEVFEQRPIRILTADDHPVLRDGIAAVLQIQADMLLVGEAATGLEAVEKFRELKPDVTLMDIQMPGMNGLEAIGVIRREHPDARIIVLTTYAGDVQALRALRLGAMGFLLKTSLRKQLLDAIRSVHTGHRHIPAEIAGEIALHATDDALTAREISILQLVAAGDANKTIAWKLSIVENTVKAHLKHIFSKLDVADRTQAVTVAMKRGIIDP